MMEALQAFAQMVNEHIFIINVIGVAIPLLLLLALMLFVPVADENPFVTLIRESGARTRRHMEQLKDEVITRAKEGRYEEDETPDDVYPGRTEDEPWR